MTIPLRCKFGLLLYKNSATIILQHGRAFVQFSCGIIGGFLMVVGESYFSALLSERILNTERRIRFVLKNKGKNNI
jgi:hypothetical protein